MLDFSKNYFQLFSLPVDYVVDASALAENYRELQRVVHPDRFASASEQERRLSMQGATLINEAFQTLKDPMLRAKYLLSLHGVEWGDGKDNTQDMEFLMEQMELREQLAEAKDQSDPFAVVADIISGIDGKIAVLIEQLTQQFSSAAPEHLQQARDTILKMQFLQKLHQDAEALEAELEDAL
jgi:molecular chaperone HscB